MCDDITTGENEAWLASTGNLSRRGFAVMSAAALAACATSPANAREVAENDVKIQTPDGVADCYFVHPAQGRHPAVIVWPDILGLRPSFRTMGKRLAESGYAVLVVNPYYRLAPAPVAPAGSTYQDPAVRAKVTPLARSLTPVITHSDATTFVKYLDGQKAVDVRKKMGVTGYCMGGPMTIRTAAAMPDRIGAGASFHGGGLVTQAPDSPHLLIPSTRAQFLHCIAENDDKNQPDAKVVLKEAYAAAKLPAEIEVYAGAMHGWCTLDNVVYNHDQAEKAWARQLATFQRALA
jgi:carboxymethylenebutenolidase